MTHISIVNRDRARPRLERIAALSKTLSQAEIARALGISRERVRQLVNRARDLGLLA